MRTKLQKWGNSLAVRIPKPLAKELGIGEGKEMEIIGTNGRIVLEAAANEYKLKELLSKIDKENLHGETDTGEYKGKEIW